MNRIENINDLYEKNQDFAEYTSDIKPIALYLPQFHEIPENNEWWGKGFTEWTNVKKAKPMFEQHNQPRIPDPYFGYYDLTDVQILKKQGKLAREHGIYAFGVYYYWFSGKRLLEKPIDIVLEHPEIDFPFFLIWANENWTRAWDGEINNVLIGQSYSEVDPQKFIQDIKRYIEDPRYMKVDGKPVIGIYNPVEIPDAVTFLEKLRKAAYDIGIGDIQIWTCITNIDAEQAGVGAYVDAEYEFPPRGKEFVSSEQVENGGILYNYRELVESAKDYCPDNDHPAYRGTMLSWDNSARKDHNYNCWKGYSPELFYRWNRYAVSYTRRHFPEDKRFLFVNAWNDWGEGTYLEPDTRYGYAAINALSKAIFDLPYWDDSTMLMNGGFRKTAGWNQQLQENTKIAIQIHLFYIDLIPELFAQLVHIQYPFDLYVTTNSEYKAAYFQRAFDAERVLHYCVRNLHIDICSNQGRDVIPFLNQMRPVYGKYKYICHIHTKKSKHNNIGNLWRKYLYDGLMGSQLIVDDILYLMESNVNVGMVYPKTFSAVESAMEWGSNQKIVHELVQSMNIRLDVDEIGKTRLVFPAGDMFWARTEAVWQILNYQIDDADIPPEKGQLDGTIMHGIERLWSYTAKNNGYSTVQTECCIDFIPKRETSAEEIELENIRNSRMWKLAKKYYIIRDKLLPLGSRRRKIIVRIAKILFKR